MRLMQSKLVRGRSLEVESEDTCPQGAANYIIVDHYNILKTGMEEIVGLHNPFLILDVQFYGRRHVVKSIFMLYFVRLSILRNGRLPQFLSDKIIQDIFMAENKSPCVKYLIQGKNWHISFSLLHDNTFSITFIIFHPRSVCKFSAMQDVFTPNPFSVLTLRKINSPLVPEFSPVGSNRKTYETKVYTLFCKYMREVACKFVAFTY